MRLLLLIMLALSACAPAAPAAPTVIPFPTVTPGDAVRGALPTVAVLALDGGNLANPATAVALANRPTATPDYAACPAPASPQLASSPASGREIMTEIVRFLSAGGAPAALESGLRGWGLLDETGVFRTDLDLNGSGQPDLLLIYRVPGEGGMLLALACANGRYVTVYQLSTPGDPPQLLQAGDLNVDGRTDLLVSSRQCDDSGENCAYETRLVSWQPAAGQFTSSLLTGNIESENPPETGDIDNDRISEIVVRRTSTGTAQTGPQRTGLTIYDWNGTGYTRSITELDPPRFKIQVIFEADRYLIRREVDTAIRLYNLMLRDTSLGNWYNDDAPVLTSYALYRLLLAYAFTESEDLIPTYQRIAQEYPDLERAPIYARLSLAFWDAFQVTNNLRSACAEVQNIAQARPEALDLLNRYGSNSPSYTLGELCPF